MNYYQKSEDQASLISLSLKWHSSGISLISYNYSILSDNYSIISDNYNIPSDNHSILSDKYNILSDNFSILSDNYIILRGNYSILAANEFIKVSIMITVHVVFTIVIIYSPLSQGVEDFLKVEHSQ